MTFRRAMVLAAGWFISQGLWLTSAYYLEFEGVNTFVFVWAASVVFFIVNIVILCQLIGHYNQALIKKQE